MTTMAHAVRETGAHPAAHAFSVRPEKASDRPFRERLLDAAMGPTRKRKSSEKLRRGRFPAEGLSLVAVDGSGRLSGTVRLWHVSAGTRNGDPVPALLLGPLASDPARKGLGIGSSLMEAALREAGRLGHGAVLLVGDHGYYGRFGFRQGLTDSLSMPGPYERERFLAVELVAGSLSGAEGVLVPTGRRRLAAKAAD